MRRVVNASAGVVLAGAFYLVLIDTRELPELYVMVAVALIAGGAFALSRRQGLPEAAFSLAWLLRAWRAVGRIPLDVTLVVRAALAQLNTPEPRRGELRAVSFRGGEDPSDLGRVALTEAIGSLAPNTIVIGVDPERELLLVHQLRRHGDRDELDILRLG